MIVLPLALCVYLWWTEATTLENLIYLVLALALLQVFVATLGIHAGLTYVNSRHAVAVSLGTVVLSARGHCHLHADHDVVQRLV